MKKIHYVLLVFCLPVILLAQPREGKNKELSISGSYQNYSSSSGSESYSAFLLSPRLGFFVAGGMELEPEMIFMFSSGTDAVYLVNGNISYNFISTGKAVPFVLVGYGFANTVPIFNVPVTRTDFTVNVFNIGAGVKVFLKEDIALRLEYRYQNFSGEDQSIYTEYYTYERKIDMQISTIQFGFSILL